MNVVQSHQPESTSQPADQHALLSADNELCKIITEYERRLEEQVALAREDVLHEIESHIQVSFRRSHLHNSHVGCFCGTNFLFENLLNIKFAFFEHCEAFEKFSLSDQLPYASIDLKHETCERDESRKNM